MLPCKAYKLLTDTLITDKRFIQISRFGLLERLYFKSQFGCHDILMLGRSPIKRRQHSDMTGHIGTFSPFHYENMPMKYTEIF